MALKINNDADKNNVSAKTRKFIEDSLRKAYKMEHPNYREPNGVQLLFDFE